ncbi:hypothetical protein [Neorhizobium sp. DT-125]|uniref:hypothetical protein n=1 Tax=Neorhizobium sp. DT-125 TaxID=3396163 RepID=UPI003F1D43BA
MATYLVQTYLDDIDRPGVPAGTALEVEADDHFHAASKLLGHSVEPSSPCGRLAAMVRESMPAGSEPQSFDFID